MSEEKITVPAVDRAIDIMEYIAQASASVTIKDLSDALNIPSASCFRIVKNLLNRKYLIEDHNSKGRYLYGFRGIELADYALYKLDLRTIALPFMKSVALELNQAVQLSILETGGVIFIEQTLPISPIHAMAKPFVPLPINVSAGGKILCAYMPPYKKSDYLSHAELAAYTQYSITDQEALMKELDITVERGYALDMQEFSIGVGCIAVPVFNYMGNCIAAIGITGDYQEYQKKGNIERFYKIMDNVASEISHQMGYQY